MRTRGEKKDRRLFFALWPDEGLRVEIHRVARTAVRRCGGKPVPARNYHLTLAFLGNVAPELFEPILEAARDLRLPSLVLDLERFGYFPEAGAFWIGPDETPTGLAEHAAALWDRLEAVGLARDVAPLRAHVTLCRRVPRLPELERPDPIAWRPAGYVLVESVTGPAGSRYKVLRRFPDAD